MIVPGVRARGSLEKVAQAVIQKQSNTESNLGTFAVVDKRTGDGTEEYELLILESIANP